MIDPNVEKCLLQLVELLQREEPSQRYDYTKATEAQEQSIYRTYASGAVKPTHAGYPEQPRVQATVFGNNERLALLHERLSQLETVLEMVHSRIGAQHQPASVGLDDPSRLSNGPVDYGEELIASAITRVEGAIILLENVNARI